MKILLRLVSIILVLFGSISCQIGPQSPRTDSGTLDLTIRYTGQWYRETFDYQPDGANIRHIAFILPSDVSFDEGAGWVFTSLLFTVSPAPFELREDAMNYKPMLDYLYDVPQGHTVIELSPGNYRLAVAFIAAALPLPDNGGILYPGITGGGVSNEFQEMVIEVGKTFILSIELTDQDGWGYAGNFASR